MKNGTVYRRSRLRREREPDLRSQMKYRMGMDAPDDYDHCMGERGSIPAWAVALWVILWIAGVAMIAGLGWLGWMAGRLVAGML